MSIEKPTLAHFRHFSSLLTNFPSTTVEKALQITPFYAKQTQSQVGRNQRKLFFDKYIRILGQLVIQTNKAKTNPIQTQFNPIQTQLKPKQSQFKANFYTINCVQKEKLLYIINKPISCSFESVMLRISRKFISKEVLQ